MKILFFVSLGIYGAAALVQILGMIAKSEPIKKASWGLFLLGLIAHLASQFEFACGFALCIPPVLLLARQRVNTDWIALGGMLATALVMGYASLQRMEIEELMPALRSFWFNFHIGAAALSYSTFLVAGCVSLRYVLQHKKGEAADSLRMRQLDQLSFRLVALGYLLLTLVIVIGAVWAEAAWTAYWTWDPKEVWALVTWIIYTAYFHIRLQRKRSALWLSWYVILAIPAFLFTFAGVNKLIPGLHSYG